MTTKKQPMTLAFAASKLGQTKQAIRLAIKRGALEGVTIEPEVLGAPAIQAVTSESVEAMLDARDKAFWCRDRVEKGYRYQPKAQKRKRTRAARVQTAKKKQSRANPTSTPKKAARKTAKRKKAA